MSYISLSALLHLVLFSLALQVGGFSFSNDEAFAVEILSEGAPKQSLSQKQIQKQKKPQSASVSNKLIDSSAVDSSLAEAENSQTDLNAALGSSQGGTNTVFSYLVQLIYKNRIYPFEAVRLKEQGQVTLSFYINEDGRITDIKLLRECEHRRLNQAALETLRSLKLNRNQPELNSLFKRSYSFTFDYIINKPTI